MSGATSGSGTGAKFSVEKINGVYTATATSVGTGYAAGDTVTILGTDLGGTVANNLIVTISTVAAGGTIATFGQVGNGRVGDGVVDTVIAVTGTSGVDTYAINGKKSDFTMSTTADAIAVKSTLAPVEFDLSKHERVTFTDTAIAYDVNGNAGDVYKLLAASLGLSDVKNEYTGIGIYLKDQGLTNKQIAELILNTDVYKTDAGGVSDETFIKHVYTNVTGNQATLTEINDLLTYMSVNHLSQADILVQAANLDGFNTTVNLVGLQTSGLEYTPYTV